MTERVHDDLGRPEQRQYFPSSMTRFATPDFACTDEGKPDVAEYSPLIAVAYTSVHANLEADILAIGFERRNDEFWQPPKAKEYASAQRAGIDALPHGDGPDPRLVELVRLLARRAAREAFEEQTKERQTTRS